MGAELCAHIQQYESLQAKVEDIVFITLNYPGKVLGHIHVSWLDPKKIRQITVVRKRKLLIWNEGGAPGPVTITDRSVDKEPTYDSFGEFQLISRVGDVVIPRVAAYEPLVAQAREFVNRCQGRGHSQGSPEEAFMVVEVLEAVSSSLVQQGKSVEVAYAR